MSIGGQNLIHESGAQAPASAARNFRKPLDRLLILPKLADLPIPEDVTVDPSWPGQLLALADHIGAYATLELCRLFGGQRISIPKDVSVNPLLPYLGEAAATELSWLYGGDRLQIPCARGVLARARRAPVVAAYRNGRLTSAQACAVLGTSRSYLRQLVVSGEGAGIAPLDLDVPSQPVRLLQYGEVAHAA